MGVLKGQKGKLKQLKKKIYKYLDQENLTTFEKQLGQVNMLPKLINKVCMPCKYYAVDPH